MEKDWLHSTYWLLPGLAAAIKKRNAAAKWNTTVSDSQPLRVDANNHTVTMLVQINGRFLTDDTSSRYCV